MSPAEAWVEDIPRILVESPMLAFGCIERFFNEEISGAQVSTNSAIFSRGKAKVVGRGPIQHQRTSHAPLRAGEQADAQRGGFSHAH